MTAVKLSSTSFQKAEPVVVSLEDLQNDSVPFSKLEKAFGPSSLGILIVKDLPKEFSALRSAVLSSASHVAALPKDVLSTLVSPHSKYLTGWSHGVETLRPGVVDTMKGSYYVNCAFHVDPLLQSAPVPSKEGSPAFPEYTTPNVWPPETSLPEFKPSMMELCNIMIDTAALVARQCDRYGQQEISGYKSKLLENVVRSSLTTKARLLHYFPPDDSNTEPVTDDDWCATHLDHGCLTALTSAMYTTSSGPFDTSKPLEELSTSPSPSSGLYIRSRNSEIVKVSIPRDCLAFQTGEALELMTKGRFKAVPHFVKGGEGEVAKGVVRNTLAVFTQPNLDEVIGDEGLTFGDFAIGVVKKGTVERM